MDITSIIESLNEAQRTAVTAPPHAMLVLAGAGSGKTRVLVHRIAWLMRVENVSPYSILAVTFTNKAAREMRGRIEQLLSFPAGNMWMGTFHGLANRLLRRHAREAGLPESFQILDSDDQYRLLRRILKQLELQETSWPPRQIQWYINGHKEEGRRACHLQESYDPAERQLQRIYREYETLCEQSGLVDFAELLLRAHEFLRDSPAALAHYQQRFRHVLVDEFQDTNSIQYAWLNLLTRDNDNLCVVGDDDQSIYGWRGAKIENLHSFQRDYPNHQIIRLEQNYRSTGNILNAANALIDHNDGRLGKNLWTDSGAGDPIALYAAFNEQDEAYFVVDRIRRWIQEGGSPLECAILYRSNAQSRQFEEKLIAMGIPYRVYGGLRFFERQEIKDALAYLYLLTHRDNDAAFERIINTPTRGIGARTIDYLRNLARAQQLTLWKAALHARTANDLPARAQTLLGGFIDLINALSERMADRPLHEQIRLAIENSGLLEYYRKEKGEQAETRVENLEELVTAARQFEAEPPGAEEDLSATPLERFLAHAALEAGEAQGDPYQACVQLMSLHSAKGLEFELVFIVGLEEGLFPSMQSLEQPGRLEEERRLCYVGLTRAQKLLYLTYAESRRLYGKEHRARPSRFLNELPAENCQEVRARANVNRPVASYEAAARSGFEDGSAAAGGSFRLGQSVFHAKFGEGVILQAEGSGAQARVQVKFAESGVKWLVLAYANLQGR
ncbi:DNA helicase II [Candidatus Methylospira mobilis]|uniref:DNA 3'-5' helicase n=1 Tax=Candidatus Methylospira mobilis TaxID=1808979 RepID=A0A5Q0BBF2_9GAMM|nr:DNA helicase II [Candidatus Methylospira mobilis]QFY41283.1 DNA helicase II [Candidatus Methylospira mobilis]WNV05495.1 DNA helicase II [Candidatus Methylospira mobilis]